MIKVTQPINTRYLVAAQRTVLTTLASAMDKPAKVPRIQKESGRVAVVRPDRFVDGLNAAL